MRSELQRLKRDTETGRFAVASSGTVAVAQESDSAVAQPKVTQPAVAQPPSPGSSSSPVLAPSPSSSTVKVAEVPIPGRKLWKILVPATVVLVAAAIAGAFYFGSRSAAPTKKATSLTEKDTVILADFTN